jgi:hypothetical protein
LKEAWILGQIKPSSLVEEEEGDSTQETQHKAEELLDAILKEETKQS